VQRHRSAVAGSRGHAGRPRDHVVRATDCSAARYELWLDQSFKPHYEPREQAEKTLDGIATESIERAKAALAAADIKEVERFTGIAISANDRRAEPFAIRAAIRRRQGNKAGEAVMAKLAARAIGEADFAVLVDRYCRSRRPMQG